MKRKIIVLIIAALLTGLGLASDQAKLLVDKIYCKIQPQECEGE